MKFHRNLFGKMLKVMAVLIPLGLLLRLYTYWGEIAIPTTFFSGRGIVCALYNGIGFVFFGLCLVFSMRTKAEKGASLAAQDESSDRSETILGGFAGKTAVWEGTLSAFATFLSGFGFLAYALSWIFSENFQTDLYQMVFAALSVLSGLYFILVGLKNSLRRARARAFFALLPALWCMVRMVMEYRDLARFVNKSLYIGQFLFLISAMIFFVYQAQLLLGEKALFRPNAYGFLSLSCVYFGLTARLPQLFAALLDRVYVDLVDASSLLIDLAITLYVAVKVFAVYRERGRLS